MGLKNLLAFKWLYVHSIIYLFIFCFCIRNKWHASKSYRSAKIKAEDGYGKIQIQVHDAI